MGGSDDLPGGGVVAVAEVVRDDGAAADEVIVLVEQQTGPGELPGLAVPVLVSPGPGGLPGAAHLARAPHVLVAALVPGDKLVVSGLGVEALDPEHGEVDASVVAAGLLAHGAGGLLGVSVGQGSVDDPGADAPPGPVHDPGRGVVLQPRVDEAGAHEIITTEGVLAALAPGHAAALLGTRGGDAARGRGEAPISQGSAAETSRTASLTAKASRAAPLVIKVSRTASLTAESTRAGSLVIEASRAASLSRGGVES